MKSKESKEEKRISLENLTGDDDIICEKYSLCATRKITVFVILQKHM